MKTAFVLILSLIIQMTTTVHAQVYAPSATEVKFSYEASFVAKDSQNEFATMEELVKFHASHLFGIFQSAKFTEKFGISYDYVSGMGSIKFPLQLSKVNVQQTSNGLLVSYKASGKMLLHNAAAKTLLNRGSLSVPLPFLLDHIYDVKCTDSHYSSQSDYWYFYDVFKKDCTYLQKEPYARTVEIEISPSVSRELDMDPRLDLLRTNNGNGDLFRIDILFGFAEGPGPRDEGRVTFEEVKSYLETLNFKRKTIQNIEAKSIYVYTGKLTLENGKSILVEIRPSLVDTEIESRTVKFARLFKEAVENADVVVYMGHSGLGGNLDIPSLEEKAGGFHFQTNKRQIFYFDACSSYAYYLESFRQMKSRAKIDILTNGIASTFETSSLILQAFLESLLSPENSGHSWEDILHRMEEPLEGGSFLLNVGGI